MSGPPGLCIDSVHGFGGGDAQLYLAPQARRTPRQKEHSYLSSVPFAAHTSSSFPGLGDVLLGPEAT